MYGIEQYIKKRQKLYRTLKLFFPYFFAAEWFIIWTVVIIPLHFLRTSVYRLMGMQIGKGAVI